MHYRTGMWQFGEEPGSVGLTSKFILGKHPVLLFELPLIFLLLLGRLMRVFGKIQVTTFPTDCMAASPNLLGRLEN